MSRLLSCNFILIRSANFVFLKFSCLDKASTKEEKIEKYFQWKETKKEKKVINLAIFITIVAVETRRSESINYKSNGNG